MSKREINLREVRATIGYLVDRAEHAGEVTIITRYGRPAAAIIPITLLPQEQNMAADTVQIASRIPGRTVTSYDLLDEIADAYGMTRAEAHDAIHATLDQLVDIDGDGVILEQRPMRPELLDSNPSDVDVYYWLTVSRETADFIREAVAAMRAVEAD